MTLGWKASEYEKRNLWKIVILPDFLLGNLFHYFPRSLWKIIFSLQFARLWEQILGLPRYFSSENSIRLSLFLPSLNQASCGSAVVLCWLQYLSCHGFPSGAVLHACSLLCLVFPISLPWPVYALYMSHLLFGWIILNCSQDNITTLGDTLTMGVPAFRWNTRSCLFLQAVFLHFTCKNGHQLKWIYYHKHRRKNEIPA